MVTLNLTKSLNLRLKPIFLHFLFLLTFSVTGFGQQKAFPTANGAAAYAVGGRNGNLYHVTNLNNSGPGSFRDAVSQSNRTIVFDVSGTIELTNDLNVYSSNLTIAGQSAPSGGITITGKPVYFQNIDNVILRYLRFRPDYDSSGIVDALNAYNCSNFIVDHCSVSWGGDEAFSLRGNSKNITVQNCILGESATGMLAGDSGSSVSDNFSILSNVWYNISHRFPNINAIRTDVINNVVHNWYSHLMVVSSRDNAKLNEINNYYQSGINTGDPSGYDSSINWLDIGSQSQRSNIRIYTDGNIYPSFLTESEDDWKLYVHRFDITGGAYAGINQFDAGHLDFRKTTPFPLLGAAPNILNAEDVIQNVPENAGANKYLKSDGGFGVFRDNVDATYVMNVMNGISEIFSYPPTDIVDKPSYINFHQSVTAEPINLHPNDYDTDDDGMADLWELNTFGTLSRNGTQDFDGDGYTDLEEFLNGVDGPGSDVIVDNEVTITSNQLDNTICEGKSITLTASEADSYLWNTGATTASITVSPEYSKVYYVTAQFSNGETAQDEITVYVVDTPTVNAGQDQTINLGESVTLTASGANSYSWNTGQTTSSITVSPTNTTTYMVSGTSNNCEDTDNVTVYVQSNNENVNADIAGGDFSVCSGVTTTLVATGGATYLWNTGATTSSITITPTETSTYTVTAFSASGNSQDQDSVTITVNTPNIEAGANQSINVGESITLTASGANTYQWSTGQTTASITVSPNSTTTYSVTGTSNGCSATDNVTVFVEEVAVNANISAESENLCFGKSTVLTATGGNSYLWSTGETTSSIIVSPSETSTYTVTAFSASGNTQDQDSIVISVVDEVIANAGPDVEICQGGSATLTAQGGTSYQWSSGATTQSITVSPNITTTYTVEVFNNGCSDTDNVTVKVNPNPEVNAGNDVTIVQGETTTLSASGAVSYLWSSGQSSSSINVSPNTTTTYTVTGYANGCDATDEVTVFVQTESVTANAGPDVSICEGEVITLTASGGALYEWNTGATTSSIQVSPSSTTVYTVTVFNSSGTNQDSDSVTVNVNPLPSVNAGNDITISQGQSATLSVSGAISYQWNTGQTSSSISVSPNTTTTYSVTGSSNGCEATDQITVYVNTGNESVNADIAGGDFSICAGATTVLVATGGSSYLWSTGETSSVIAISPTQTTTYTVTAFSESGTNQAQDSVTVSVYGNANAGEDIEICLGSSTTLTASEGQSYLWSTGEITQSITVSPSETTVYTVEIYDRYCTGTDDVIVTVNETLDVDAGDDMTITQGQTVTLTASGADTYLWSTGETSASINVNPSTTSSYSVTGFSGTCEATDEIVVTVESESIIANAGPDVTICSGESTTLSASGGTSYLWNTGQTSASISVSPETTTTYSVTVFGENQANSDQDDVTVTVNPLPSVNAGNNVTITEGNSVTLTASGAETYLWSTGETSASISVNPSSNTQYTVTGYLNGCEATDDVMVFVENSTNETVDADIAGGNFSICAGTTTVLVATGGASYLWSTGETSAAISISPNETTTYTVTAFSESGNTQDQDSVTVSVYGIVNAGEDVAICVGSSTTLTASEGQSYLWSTGETTQSITVSPNETTLYSVEVSNRNCSNTDDVLVTVNQSLNVNAGNDISIEEGESTTLTATGADSYLWSTGETTQSITVSPNDTTTYFVIGYSNTCEGMAEVTVFVEEDPYNETVVADIAGGNFTICYGSSTTLVATGGHSYLWSTGETTSVITVSPSVTTTYIVTAFSESGNSQDQDSIIIGVNNVQVDAGTDVTILSGESTILTASGADSYLWSTGETTQSITVNPSSSTTYSVTGFRKGCHSSDDVTVAVGSSTTSVSSLIVRDSVEPVKLVVFQEHESGFLSIKIVGDIVDTQKVLTITNINGRAVYNAVMNGNEVDKAIDVSNLTSGIYALRLTYGNNHITKKIVIK